MQGELSQLRRQHQLILNAMEEGVYGLDLQGNVTFVNPAAAAMIQWDMDALIGQSMHKVLHHSHPDGSHYPREACPIYAAFQDGSVRRISGEVFWRKDGTSFPVEYISTPMRDESGRLVGSVVTFRDITKQKWAEAVLQQANEELEAKVQARTAELQQANQRLKQLSEMRSRFVSMVCHEFRNPLHNIALTISSLDRYSAQLSAAQKHEYLLGITANVDRMTRMIDDILVIGKIEAKFLEVKPQTLDLVTLCQDLVTEIQRTEHRQAIQFLCDRTHIRLPLDERLLRSILNNILINAVRYTPAEKSIFLKLSQTPTTVTFQVQDQGIGIPEADQAQLFEPFHRGRNVSNIPGTGLGLNIVKQFVELQGGHITVESQVGVGTTFTVILPLPSNPDS
jgi:PAS domain S-box-containing protein